MTAVDSVKRALQDISGVRLAVLFGSEARGRARSGSDIDIAIAMERSANVPATLEVELARLVGRPVSVTRMDSAPPLLRFEISRDGVVLLERHAGAWADFRAKAMIDWWDWAPTVQMMHGVMRQRLDEEANRGQA